MNVVHLTDLNLLRVLAVMLEERNVTRAAARLRTTQSAVSHALRRLRELLDDPLFVRTPKEMVPTARALAMSDPLALAFEQVGRALRHETDFDPQTSKRTFRLAGADYAGVVLLPGLVARLQREAPNVDLVVRQVEDRYLGALEDGEVDLTFSLLKQTTAAIRTRKLLSERFVTLVREGHPLAKRRLTLERFVELPHILVSPHGSRRGFVDHALAEHGLERRVAVVVPHFLVAPMIIAETDMVLTIAERVARRLAATLPVRVVEVPVEVRGYDLHLFWHERDHKDAAHAWLRRAILAVAQK